MRFSLVIFMCLVLGGPLWAEDEEAPPNIAYHKLKPSIVTNLTGGPEYIRTDIQLMTEKGERLYEIELHDPALRHILLMVISEQDGKALQTPDGKESLRQAALEAVNEVLKVKTGDALVKDLYFSNFYVR